MLKLSEIAVNSDNYFKIVQTMKNYLSVNESVSRDFITLSISKAEEILNGCHWDVNTG